MSSWIKGVAFQKAQSEEDDMSGGVKKKRIDKKKCKKDTKGV